MRINKFVASSLGVSRRTADLEISKGNVWINGKPAQTGSLISPTDVVTMDGKLLELPTKIITIMLNKPAGYVCSRQGQGSATVYELLPPQLHKLKSIGRLDKDSTGLLLLTNDGQLAHQLTHPSFQKTKLYQVSLSRELSEKDWLSITGPGVMLKDGQSRLKLNPINNSKFEWIVSLNEGRNRQIRRTFESLGYAIKKLHRTRVGSYQLGLLAPGQYKEV